MPNLEAPGVMEASVYEIDGRLIIRTVHQSDRLGIESEQSRVLDGYPGISHQDIGLLVVDALQLTREIARPAAWGSLRNYAQPLLDLSPNRYRSYRAWLRVARHVSVRATAVEVSITRLQADPNRGGWNHNADNEDRRTLPAGASSEAIGAAVADLLA